LIAKVIHCIRFITDFEWRFAFSIFIW
jgi:hypothetical protein